MNVELSHEAEQLIQQELDQGNFESPGQVIEAALRSMSEGGPAYWAALEQQDMDADADIAAGATRVIDDAFLDELRQRQQERTEARRRGPE